MKIIDYIDLIAEFDCKEIYLIRNSLLFVYNSIEDWEFQTRLGIEREEFFQIIKRIEGILHLSLGNMRTESTEVRNTASKNIEIKISKNELLGIGNALNEVCNGLEVPEFEKSIGADEQTVYVLLKQISKEFKKINVE